MLNSQDILECILAIPEGYSESHYCGERYRVTKRTFNQGRSFKIYAHSLQGNHFISLNFYQLKDQSLLKPCEMPAKTVCHFLKHHQTLN